ncbi:MAG: lysoplasmalogenase [Erysipelotrichia bacterium]|nr:lysoplasmalogenase [Erysipelotrichia bacterium]
MKYFIICIIGLLVQLLFIKVELKNKYLPAVILKGTASLIFVILGFICSKQSIDLEFAKMVKFGLIFGMFGDILLNLRHVFKKIDSLIFLVGILVFLTGHVFYLLALIPLCNNTSLALFIGVVMTILILIWIFSKIEAKLAFKIFGVFYIGAIVIMTSVALINYISKTNINSLIYLIGALLFTTSDIILIFNTFGKESKPSLRIANLLLYYLGQLAIAISLLFI